MHIPRTRKQTRQILWRNRRIRRRRAGDTSIFRSRAWLNFRERRNAFASHWIGRIDAARVVVPHVYAAADGEAEFDEEDAFYGFEAEGVEEPAAVPEVLFSEETEECPVCCYVFDAVLLEDFAVLVAVHTG
jgi:hypothetical protein